MSLKVYIGGKFYDKADAKISVYDHGLLYGDGVFEGIRSYSGNVFLNKAVNPLPRCAITVPPPFHTTVTPLFFPATKCTVAVAGLLNV